MDLPEPMRRIFRLIYGAGFAAGAGLDLEEIDARDRELIDQVALDWFETMPEMAPVDMPPWLAAIAKSDRL